MTFHPDTAKKVLGVLNKWKDNAVIPIYLEGNKNLIHPQHYSALLKKKIEKELMHIDGRRLKNELEKDIDTYWFVCAQVGKDERGSGTSHLGSLVMSDDPTSMEKIIETHMDQLTKNAALTYGLGASYGVVVKNPPALRLIGESAPAIYMQPVTNNEIDPTDLEEDVLEAVKELMKVPGAEKIVSYISTQVEHCLFLDTDGSIIEQHYPLVNITLSMHGSRSSCEEFESSDGLYFVGIEQYSKDILERKVQKLIEDFEARKNAIRIKTGSCPVLMDGSATSVFFHEALQAHQFSGKLIAEKVSTVYAERIGELIIPECFTIIDDPTLENALGSFKFDEEGVRGQRVVMVENGFLRNFLLDKTSAAMLSKEYGIEIYSNGKARSELGVAEDEDGDEVLFTPEPRTTNMIVESSNLLEEGEMFEYLLETIRDGSEDYGLMASSGGGEVKTDGNFYQFPRQIWHVDGDGNKTMVEGTFLKADPEIILHPYSGLVLATGLPYDTYFGACGAESGFVYHQARAPAMLLERMSVNAIPKEEEKTERLLPR